MTPAAAPVPPSASIRAAKALGDRRAQPRIDWVARLLGISPRDAAKPFAELGPMVSLETQVRAAHRSEGRSFYAQFRAPLELFALTRLIRPAHVIETGVSSGVSSMHFLLGLRENGTGTLHSIDWPTHQKSATFTKEDSPVALPPGRASGWAIPEGISPGWDLRLGRSEAILPGLVDSLPRVDLFLHDSYHSPRHLTFELEAVEPKLVPGSVVLADNTEWTGDAFPRFAARVGAKVFRRGRTDLVGLRMPGRPETA
ncbi:MAG TPA: class I SAM-dependent methyltransferase [Thermoplasmata archaeon]|nr:class I SAM-dependent methyltransferase [Thermoplasmata archaeon]